MEKLNRYDNKLGICGWAFKGRWGFERYLYILHRLTGLGILLYFLMHIFVTSFRAMNIYLWAPDNFFHHPIFRFGEYLVFLAFAFHAFNGLRLIFVEFGFAVGKPIEPVYPYKTSLTKQRPLFIVMMVFAAILAIFGSYEFVVSLGKMAGGGQ